MWSFHCICLQFVVCFATMLFFDTVMFNRYQMYDSLIMMRRNQQYHPFSLLHGREKSRSSINTREEGGGIHSWNESNVESWVDSILYLIKKQRVKKKPIQGSIFKADAEHE